MDHKRYPAAPNARGLVEGQIISTTGWIQVRYTELEPPDRFKDFWR
jgi:hypothetical protein